MNLAATLFLAAALAGAPTPDATAQARKALAEGEKLTLQGKYELAISRFEASYALKPLPLLRYNIARCYERLQAAGPALRAYRDFLRLSPKAVEREAALQAMAGLQRQLRDRGVQQLLVLTEPAAADVEVDGQVLGPSPASIELPPGEHVVTARLPGYAVASRRVVVDTAAMMDVRIELEPPAPPPLTAALEAPAAGSADVPRATELAPVASTVAPELVSTAPKPRVVTWVAGGLGLATLGAGIALGLAASNSSTQLRDGKVRTRAEAQALYDSASSLSEASTAAYGVAGMALVTAVVFLFVEGR